MKKILMLALVTVVAAIAVPMALAWHADGVNVSAACNTQTGKFAVTATIIQNAQYPATLFSVSPTEIAPNSNNVVVTVVVKFTNGEKQTFTKTISTGACVVPCEPTIVYVDRPVDRIVYVDREVPVEKIVYVDREVKVEVPVEKIVYVERVSYVNVPVEVVVTKEIPVEKIVEKPVVKIVTKTKKVTVVKVVYKTKTRTIIKYITIHPKPHVLPPTK